MNKVKLDMCSGLQLFQIIVGLMKEQASTEDVTLEIQAHGSFVTLCDVKTEKILSMEFDNFGGTVATWVKEKNGCDIPGPDFEIYKESELEKYIQTVFGLEV